MKTICSLYLLTAFLASCTSIPRPWEFSQPEPDAAVIKEASPRIPFTGDTCKAQASAQRRADQLLVTISTKFASSGGQQFGAGIILSVKGTTAYILTAKHVVSSAGAGKPTIEVAIETADGAQHKLIAEVASRFSLASEPYRDTAILQADLSRAGFVPAPDWAVLRSQTDRDLRDFVVVGNPRGRGKTSTPKGDGDYRTSQELRVNSGVMEAGYSGGGVFNSSLRLVGLVFEDGGQYAAAYPIDPVIDLLNKAGVPVDLKLAPEPKKNIYLSDVEGSTPELREAGRAVMTDALEKNGFEATCASGNSYKLSSHSYRNVQIRNFVNCRCRANAFWAGRWKAAS